jgi:hypothetical protein
MTTLIQQRMVLDRQRGRARLQLGLGAFFALLAAIAFGRDADAWVPWGYLVIGVVAGLLAWRQLRAARRAIRAFEAEHGAGAGVQEPLR